MVDVVGAKAGEGVGESRGERGSDRGTLREGLGVKTLEPICVVCGQTLRGRRADALHCSGACRAEAARVRAILSRAPGQRYRSLNERLAARRKRTQRV